MKCEYCGEKEKLSIDLNYDNKFGKTETLFFCNFRHLIRWLRLKYPKKRGVKP